MKFFCIFNEHNCKWYNKAHRENCEESVVGQFISGEKLNILTINTPEKSAHIKPIVG